jgi:hypothetical protein
MGAAGNQSRVGREQAKVLCLKSRALDRPVTLRRSKVPSEVPRYYCLEESITERGAIPRYPMGRAQRTDEAADLFGWAHAVVAAHAVADAPRGFLVHVCGQETAGFALLRFLCGTDGRSRKPTFSGTSAQSHGLFVHGGPAPLIQEPLAFTLFDRAAGEEY